MRRLDNPPFTFRGTGFVVGDGNLVATNAHVVGELSEREGDATLAILQRSGNGTQQVRRAQIVATAPEVDLAILRFADGALPRVNLASAATVREGRGIAFTGYPIGGVLGYSAVTHKGIIASIAPIALPGASAQQLSERQIRRLKSGSFDILQLDATAYPGNSGSPVFDLATGEVVGILNMVLVRGTRESALSQPTGIAYAIPVVHLIELLRTIR
ncbi:MAG: trypsin-like peptidase domain-containing protein [Burkholderiales bacterium]|nr:trypsin-like peptidase domain-containing protein [Burkholderiales bacterium]